MEFRTSFSTPLSNHKIDYKTNILSIGSCFAQHMGSKLDQHKFNILNNPFGTLFHPLAIQQLLTSPAINQNLFVENEGIFRHFNYHSELSASSQTELQEILSEKHEEVNNFIQKADTIIITLGTAFVYQHLETNEIVANCHKVPQRNFEKKLLSVEEIINSFMEKREFWNQFKKIIITVSPVRHIKDSIPLNNVSKSTLHLACHQLCEQFHNMEYFPAYELMNDDLRDYRFYKEDMIHPNEVAQNYIWEKFQETYFEPKTIQQVSEIQKILQAVAHRPFNQESEAHQKFLKKTLEKMEKQATSFNFSQEIEQIKQQIK